MIECGLRKSPELVRSAKKCIGLQINSPAENTAGKQQGRPFELGRSG
jgi:hypothetical protein